MSELYLKQLELGPMKNFVYLVGDARAPEVAVVDPAWDVKAIQQAAESDGKRIAAAIATHSHDDHTNGLPELLRESDVPVYVNAEELQFSDKLRETLGDAARPTRHGESVKVGPLALEFLHTPGHTPGAQCIHCADAVLTGDTLFVNKCGRCDLRGGSPEAMFKSLSDVLLKLPESTRLLPGHDYGDVKISSIGRERANNPYCRFQDVRDFVRFRMQPR